MRRIIERTITEVWEAHFDQVDLDEMNGDEEELAEEVLFDVDSGAAGLIESEAYFQDSRATRISRSSSTRVSKES